MIAALGSTAGFCCLPQASLKGNCLDTHCALLLCATLQHRFLRHLDWQWILYADGVQTRQLTLFVDGYFATMWDASCFVALTEKQLEFTTARALLGEHQRRCGRPKLFRTASH